MRKMGHGRVLVREFSDCWSYIASKNAFLPRFVAFGGADSPALSRSWEYGKK